MARRVLVFLGTFLLSVVMSLSASSRQTASEPECHFVVWFHDGGKVSFPLDTHPVVTYSDGMLVVSSVMSRVEYSHSLVRKFTIEEVEEVLEEPAPDSTLDSEPTPEAELYFVVWLHNGAQIGFPFTANPRLAYSNGNIVVTTSQEQLSYPHTSVRKFTFADEDISQNEAADVAITVHNAQWHCQGDAMVFSDCTPGECVDICDAQGHLLQQYTISDDGTLQIPLHSFAGDMYIVKTESITYKFMKK